MSIAIIPARGGSKRIPKKNIKSFFGKPIISHTIAALQESGLFDDIIVSTDDDAIATVAKESGASVPFLRNASLANDQAATIPVLLHAEAYCKKHFSAEYYCCVYPVNPLLQIKKLKEAQSLLKKSEKSFAISVVSYDSPVQRSFYIDEQEIHMLFPEGYGARSQDLKKVYHDAAQFYWWKAGQLFEDSVFFSNKTIPVVIDPEYVQDVDMPSDWLIAEIKYQLLMKEKVLETSGV